jgi:hypothetical protein
LELVQCTNYLFFVTSHRSPRFNWNTRLTHLDVGRNIDYSAPGHIGGDPKTLRRAFVAIVERTTFVTLSQEMVYVESIQDPTTEAHWLQFNLNKERLYNETMEKLGLKYRFKCVFEFPQTQDEIRSVMTQTTPPSAKWWDDHCPHLALLGEMGKPQREVLFCNFQSKYNDYWELLRCVYSFGVKYFQHLLSSNISAHCGFDFSKRLYQITDEVCSKTGNEMAPGEYENLLDHTRHELEKLATVAEEYLEWERLHGCEAGSRIPASPRGIGYHIQMISFRVRLFARNLYMHVFQASQAIGL